MPLVALKREKYIQTRPRRTKKSYGRIIGDNIQLYVLHAELDFQRA